MLLIMAYEKRRRILCCRELQNSINESVHYLLKAQAARLNIPGFEIGSSYIRHANGSEFIFKGLRTNANEIKSMEAVDICWVEEAQNVSEDSWEVLTPTVRRPDSEIWVTFNPNEKNDPTSQRFIEHPLPDSRIVKANYWDNPWFPEELRKEMEWMKEHNPKSYLHVWEGEYKDPNEGGLVSYAWSFANIEPVAYNPEERIYLTCDFNVDPMCWGVAHKPVIDRKNYYKFFGEVCRGNTNIIASAKDFAKQFGKHKAGIVITGDASGNSRSDLSEKENETRYDRLERALSDLGVTNFSRNVASKNPAPESRLERWNELLCDVDGHRRVLVDPSCTQIIYSNENVRYKPGCDDIWMPTPAQIKEKPELKYLRNDMIDATSYLTWTYDPKILKLVNGPSVTVPKGLSKVFRR